MKKPWVGYALLGAGCYLVFLVVTLPAAWLASGVARATQGVVTLSAPLGSIWSGEAGVILHRAPEPPQRLGQLKWGINPLWLLTARLGVGARLDVPAGGEARLRARVGFGSATLRDINARLPAQQLALWYAPLALASPTGQVEIKSAGLDIDAESLRGTAELTWQDAGVSLTSVKPLGNYRLTLTGQGPDATFKLDTTDGVLELTGQGSLQIKTGRLNATGFATAKSRKDELDTLLQLIGPDQGDGRRAWSLNR